MQTIQTREPLIFVFQALSGMRKIRVPAQNFPEFFFLLAILNL